jgi:hypothetical protein
MTEAHRRHLASTRLSAQVLEAIDAADLTLRLASPR